VSETVQKRLVVTFNDGLPLGVHGAFTYEGQKWIAVPLKKYNAIQNASDKLVSVLARMRALLTRRIVSHPDQATWIVPALAEIDIDRLVREKIEAQTS